MEFLDHLSRSKAPLTLTDPDEINNLVVLRAAGFVAAFTLRPLRDGDGSEDRKDGQGRERGRFLALTPEGRAALARGIEGA
ncbi:hypothetical protein [Variovorax sp. IB41]|uniref:hypothetical protein n=1 Tax=Variovorax sp. IB41 TaxID=2779370 RepID=UPI0018E73E7E|nr:hypothetical protein [Variovorax sp. IB41]MBJ2154264.1 hypothetical protein [Variovorax sp. IB41]